MAIPRTARLLRSEAAGSHGRILHFAIEEGGALGFTGGQYVIINTGVPRTDGKQQKRAYSIISGDDTQETFSIAVYALEGGAGARALHLAQEGATFPFSGPWGSYLPDDSTPRRTLLFATDSGITAAMGLLRAGAFAPQRPQASVHWLCAPDMGFLAVEQVREEVERLGAHFQHHACPPPNHPERLFAAQRLASERFDAHRPERIYLSGDGAALTSVKELFVTGKGLDVSAIRMETFFHHPSRKAAA